MTFPDMRAPHNRPLSAEIAGHVQELVERNRLHNQRNYPADGDSVEVGRVGVVGAGFMGSLVAAVAVEHGWPVVITDQNEQTLRESTSRIHNAMLETHGEGNERWENLITEQVRTTDDIADVAGCDLVVEAVIEDARIKKHVFADLETHGHRHTLILSNTSTLPIGELGSDLENPSRFCGLHFFPPLGEQPMLEIIPGNKTSKETTAKVIHFSEAINRIPVVVPDGRGFVVNRLIMAYMSAGMRMLAFGVDAERIDEAASDFGMRLGPIRLCDEIGLDIVLNSAWSLAAESDALIPRTPVLVRLVKSRQLGRKTGRGFYIHRPEEAEESPGDVNTEAARLITKNIEREEHLTDLELTCAIILPIVAEATRILTEQRARDTGQIDLASMFGLGFPVWRGGLLFWADTVGSRKIEAMLESLSHFGPHLRPTPALTKTADGDGRLCDLLGEVVERDSTAVTSADTRKS